MALSEKLRDITTDSVALSALGRAIAELLIEHAAMAEEDGENLDMDPDSALFDSEIIDPLDMWDSIADIVRKHTGTAEAEPENWLDIYTTAPADFDGFGTYEVERIEGNGKTRDGLPIRRVSTKLEAYTWQRMRYNSGNHFAHTPESWATDGGYYTDPAK